MIDWPIATWFISIKDVAIILFDYQPFDNV